MALSPTVLGLDRWLHGNQWSLEGGYNTGDNADSSDNRVAWSGTAEVGRWTKFIVGTKFQQGTSSNPYQGWVELWKDGVQVRSRMAFKTLYIDRNSYLKLGLYRDATNTANDTIYQDGWKMGTTYDSVAG